MITCRKTVDADKTGIPAVKELVRVVLTGEHALSPNTAVTAAAVLKSYEADTLTQLIKPLGDALACQADGYSVQRGCQLWNGVQHREKLGQRRMALSSGVTVCKQRVTPYWTASPHSADNWRHNDDKLFWSSIRAPSGCRQTVVQPSELATSIQRRRYSRVHRSCRVPAEAKRL